MIVREPESDDVHLALELLRGKLDLGEGQAGNVPELPSERKESIDPFIHHTESLSG